MKTQFQLLDVDYVNVDQKPCLRFFGRTADNKSITVFYDKFYPYFYVLPSDQKTKELEELIQEKFKSSVKKIERVEKYPPIGYLENPMQILKITLNDPSKTPIVRDDLTKSKLVKEIFEADILFKYRFMIDNNIFGMKWYEVEGINARTNTVKTEKKITAKSFKEIEKEDNMKFKYMSIDIETISSEGGMPDPNKDQIILISAFFYPSFRDKNTMVIAAKKIKNNDSDIFGFSSEKEMLKEFYNIIEQFDPDFILGYNTSGFDLPYIDARFKKNNIPRTIGRCTQKPMRIFKFAYKTRVTVPGRVFVDVYSLIKESTIKFGLFKGLKRYGLGDVSKLILGEGKVDVAHSEINDHWEDNGEKLRKLLNYSRKDAELPIKIFLKKMMLDKFIEISKVSGVVLQDALDSGETLRIENLLFREFNKKNFVISCKPTNDKISRRHIERGSKGLKGAFVLDPVVGFHDKCVVYLDFKSMYPSIFINMNICPTTLLLEDKNIEHVKTAFGSKFVTKEVRQGIFPKILSSLLETRDKIKREMNNEKDPSKRNYLYAKQYAFKTVANAFYGYSGYMRARLYVFDIASGITSTGRDMIMKTKGIIEKKTPYTVIYGDTDSVMVKLDTEDVEKAFKIGKDISEIVNEEIHHILKIKIENVFKTMIILAKKRYAGWSFEQMNGEFDEKMVTKGIETVRRDWCDLVSETLEKILNTILKEKDVKGAVKIMKDTIEDIKTGKMDIDKLVMTKSVSRSLKSYKGIQPHVELVKKMQKRDPASAPKIGDRVGFVIVGGKELVSKRAEDPEYIKKHGLKIDSKYYIESQLLPPLERVFEALNVNKSELMGVGKQLGLFDALKNSKVEEKPLEDCLEEIDGFICDSCSSVFRRPPLTGKCNYCGGEIVFKNGEKKSRTYKKSDYSVT